MGDSTVCIGPPTVDRSGEWVRATYPVSNLGPEALWFEVDGNYGDFITDSCDAPVVALLILAMRQGSDVLVEGGLSPRLWWNLHNTVIPVMGVQNPSWPRIRVEATRFTEPTKSVGKAVATGLSCGVDSLSAVHDHLLDPDLRDEDRITHFLFNHLGSHGEREEEADIRSEIRWQGVRAAAEELGRPVIRVRSNQQAFFGYHPDVLVDFPGSLTLRNASVPLLLQGGIRRWLLASGMEWKYLRVRETPDQSEADPVLLPALNTDRVELVSVGCEYTRVGRTRNIASMEVARRYLDVCWNPGDGLHNCSACEKCVRTLVTLDVLGELDRFSRTFDLDLYRRNRRENLLNILVNREGHFESEIFEFMREIGFRNPKALRAQAWARRMYGRVPARIRKWVRRVRKGIW